RFRSHGAAQLQEIAPQVDERSFPAALRPERARQPGARDLAARTQHEQDEQPFYRARADVPERLAGDADVESAKETDRERHRFHNSRESLSVGYDSPLRLGTMLDRGASYNPARREAGGTVVHGDRPG